MREIRIYQPGTYCVNTLMELSPEASQHVGTVLRMQPQEYLILFSGDNTECRARIHEVKKKHVVVSLEEIQEVNRESPLSLHLGQAISKGERMEWVVQKAVELGVAEITPLFTDYCVVKRNKEQILKKVHYWQTIAISACEQSGRNVIPIIHPPLELSDYMQTIKSKLKFILHPNSDKSWRNYTLSSKQCVLIVGPEGGLSDIEVDLAMQQGCFPLSLGPRILRTETAAITAVGLLQALGGDL